MSDAILNQLIEAESSPRGAERRTEIRYPADEMALLRSVEDGVQIKVHLIDTSNCGYGFEADQALLPGSEWELSLSDYDDDLSPVVMIRIRWSKEIEVGQLFTAGARVV